MPYCPMTDASMVEATAEPKPAFEYVYSPEAASLLEAVPCSLFITTYQAGKLIVARAAGGRLSTLLRTFDQAMGLAVEPRRTAVGTRDRIWLLRNAPDIAPQLEPAGRHGACFLPRSCHVTGDIRVHELAWAGDELWAVNTRFSCLSTLHPDYSFVPRWRPPFVSALVAEDRCHLNGLATVDGQPKYVTALGVTDSEGGWRENKAGGGCLIDVPSGELIAQGLCMPHSPRWHDGRLWLLDSGTGRLVTMNEASGTVETVGKVPGYARGLDFVGRFAFIGLSKIRETTTFGGLPIAEQHDELKCGVWVIDVATGGTAATIEFQSGVEEIFDVRLLAGLRFPAVMGFEKDTLQNTFVVPRETEDGHAS